MFRLAFAWLAACGGVAPLSATTTEASTSSGANTTSTTDGETTMPSPSGDTSSGTASSSTTSRSETSGSDDTGSSETSEATTFAESSTTGTPQEPCVAGCATEFACSDEWASLEACVGACEANLDKAAAFAKTCAEAWARLSACFGELDCNEYGEYLKPTMFPYPCASESDALGFECKGQ